MSILLPGSIAISDSLAKMQHFDDHDVDDNNIVDADDDVEDADDADDVEDADDDVDEDEVDVDEDEDGALMSPAQGASVVTPAVGPWEPITSPQHSSGVQDICK